MKPLEYELWHYLRHHEDDFMFTLLVVLEDAEIENDGFCYEYGSIRGFHRGSPRLLEPHFKILRYDPELLWFYSLEQAEAIISSDEAFISKHEDSLIDELLLEQTTIEY